MNASNTANLTLLYVESAPLRSAIPLSSKLRPQRQTSSTLSNAAFEKPMYRALGMTAPTARRWTCRSRSKTPKLQSALLEDDELTARCPGTARAICAEKNGYFFRRDSTAKPGLLTGRGHEMRIDV